MIVKSTPYLLDNGMNFIRDTKIGTFGNVKKVVMESPIQFNGGNFNVEHIGAFSYFGYGSLYYHVKKIGRFCAMAPQVIMGYAEHPTSSLTPHPMFAFPFDKSWKQAEELFEDDDFISDLQKKTLRLVKRRSKIEIGNDVWIGNGAYVSRGVKIGDGAIIAARAVVANDVPPYTIVGGTPAKPIRQRFSDEIVEKLLQLKWWNYGPGILKDIDITSIEQAVYEIESRIEEGFPEYKPDSFEFDWGNNKIIHHKNGDVIEVT